jgi:hypothetical protein
MALPELFLLTKGGEEKQAIKVTANGRFLTIVPATPLANDTLFTLQPSEAFSKLLKKAKSDVKVWSFRSKPMPPPAATPPPDFLIGAAQLLQPATSAQAVPAHTEPLIGLLFPLAPDAFIAMKDPLVVKANGTAIEGTWTLDGQMLRFKPKIHLPYSSNVVIIASQEFASALKMPPNPLPWSFQIEPKPTVRFALASTYPEAGGDGYTRDTVIQLSFTRAIKPESVTKSTVKVTIAGTEPAQELTGSLSVDGKTIIFTPMSASLQFSTRYVVSVKSGLLDIDGNELESPSQVSFKTIDAPVIDKREIAVVTPWQNGNLPLDAMFEISLGSELPTEAMAGNSAFKMKNSKNEDILFALTGVSQT